MVAAPDEVAALPTPGHSRAVPFPWQTVTPAPDQGTHITELRSSSIMFQKTRWDSRQKPARSKMGALVLLCRKTLAQVQRHFLVVTLAHGTWGGQQPGMAAEPCDASDSPPHQGTG